MAMTSHISPTHPEQNDFGTCLFSVFTCEANILYLVKTLIISVTGRCLQGVSNNNAQISVS